MEEETKQTKDQKPLPLRLILFLIVGVLIITGIWYGYYWFSSTNMKLQKAEEVTGQAQAFEELSQKIKEEQQRCQQFIAQEQGEFGEFQYCERFIEWANQKTSFPDLSE